MTETIIPHNYLEIIKNSLSSDCKEPEKLIQLLLDNLPGLVINVIKDKIKSQISALLKLYTLEDFNISITNNTITVHNYFPINMNNYESKVTIKITVTSTHFICSLLMTGINETNKTIYQTLFEKIIKVIDNLSREQINFNYKLVYISQNIIENNKLIYSNYQKIYNHLRKKNIDVKLYTDIDRIIIKVYDTKRKIYETFTLKLSYIIGKVFNILTNMVILPRRKISYILLPINATTRILYLITYIDKNEWVCIIISENDNVIKQEDIEIYKTIFNEVINKELDKIYTAITTTIEGGNIE